GSAARDTIFIATDDGVDVVFGFDPASDVLDLEWNINSTDINSPAAALAATFEFGWALVDLGDGNLVVLEGLKKDQITAANFTFHDPSLVPLGLADDGMLF
ncbi:MAG: hypothetical protein IT561_07435, partial [Alphaproteobacteria bacterium]|nr:hypothetical protein [Alphaproteobacteria bacterium]